MKVLRLFAAVLAVAVLLFVASLAFFSSRFYEPAFVVRSTVALPAGLKQSWSLLSGFSSYPKWNPYLIKVEGHFAVGGVLEVQLIDGNFDDVLTVKPTVSEIVPGQSFCWRGKLKLPGLFDTRHCFVLKKSNTAGTLLEQFEEFGGLVAHIVPAEQNMTAHVEKAFNKMHQAMVVKLSSSH
ncbi:MAG: hypothetical protein AB8B86_10515 [Pseudomonadales bacterium]